MNLNTLLRPLRAGTHAGARRSLGATVGLGAALAGLDVLAKAHAKAHLDGKTGKSGKALGTRRRVGGTGSSHKGSHWEGGDGATVRVDLDHHGPQDAVVFSQQKHQVKAFVPGLGMFAVEKTSVAPSESSESVQWDREKAESTLPAVGSLVNIKAPGESQILATLAEPLHEGMPGDAPIEVTVGTLGRKQEMRVVERQHILGPHVPRTVKGRDGRHVADSPARRTQEATALDAARGEAAVWRAKAKRNALYWLHTLEDRRALVVSDLEAAWFAKNFDRIAQMCASVCRQPQTQLDDPNDVEDVISEACFGAISGLRLWEQNPEHSRAFIRRTLAEDLMEAARKQGKPITAENALRQVADKTDAELKIERAMNRAFSKARAAASHIKYDDGMVDPLAQKRGRLVRYDEDAGREDHRQSVFLTDPEEENLPIYDDESESVSGAFAIPSYTDADSEEDGDTILSTTGALAGRNSKLEMEHLADIISNRIARAARLTPSEQYVLAEGMSRGWEDHSGAVSFYSHTPIPESDAREVVRGLDTAFGVTVKREQLPVVWARIKNRLRAAVVDNPDLLIPIMGLSHQTRRERGVASVVGEELTALMDDPQSLSQLQTERAARSDSHSDSSTAEASAGAQGSLFADAPEDGRGTAWDTSAVERVNRERAARSGMLGPTLRKSMGVLADGQAPGVSRTDLLCEAFAARAAL